jgi:hypothetical protein
MPQHTAQQNRIVDLSDATPEVTGTQDHRQRLADDLDAARQELKDAILTATKVSRRVQELEWALWRADQRQPAHSGRKRS